ncbi:MAG: hypothetical protein J7545_13240 [Roseofilum sp. SBFL]|uniref:hypothetical protein n=1 Tax=unclassified Roseofilum TaxID=2620099 RepID=UPI001B0E7484|nr:MULTISPECIES: hypothetical protein [unclassified Roseofilum]MBP0012733.1 hypothetical protein [Roseofilum sp. SID3]MBP0023703.1 hypothetical protein [Roseofilum sp. SID2]MBP0039860.1 hypothetical protein [Roseofilum sp. SID1]MBP0042917.1 hypothetical protein [Roseofilum sp. SBFL]
MQPKRQRKRQRELPEWEPGGSGQSSPLERLGNSARVQAKLAIGQPHDPYEQQADRVAQDVVETIHTPETPSTLQREMGGEGEEEMQMKPMIQRQEAIAIGSGKPPTIQRALATTQEYTTMKANARKEKTKWSGALSAKNYGKKKNSYEEKRQDNVDILPGLKTRGFLNLTI